MKDLQGRRACRGALPQWRLPVAVALLIWPSVGSRPMSGIDFVVTRFTDSSGACGANDCSLRAAVIASNAVGGPDRILLSAGTYELTLAGLDNHAAVGDLDIRDEVEVIGVGAELSVIDANGIDRVFEVLSAGPGGDLKLRDLTVRGGSIAEPGSGGGIRVSWSALTLDHVHVRNNVYNGITDGSPSPGDGGGGISSVGGTIEIVDSAIFFNGTTGDDGDGGGIHLSGHNDVQITRSRIEYNTSNNARGGGLIVGDPGPLNSDPDHLDLLDSVVAHNYSGESGGGIFFVRTSTSTIDRSTIFDNFTFLSGGGCWIDSAATVSITNSTLSRNEALLYGAAGFVLGEVHLENVTISDNSAPLFNAVAFSAASTFKSTILGGNCNPGETGTSHGGNIESPGDTCGLDQPTDQANVTAAALDLSDLWWNGGETPTHIPQPGSVARDQGTDSGGCPPPSEDQRGAPRPIDGDGVGGADCDVGSVEAALGETGPIFADGFEDRSGDDRWSSTVP